VRVYTPAVDRAARERLTGAVILVAALAIVVPELLSGPGSDGAVTGEPGTMAEAGPPLATYDLAIDPGAVEPTPAPQPAATAQPEVAAPTAPGPAAATPAPGSSAASADARGEVRPPAAPPAAAPPAGGTSAAGWWVPLGSFSSADNARRLARELRARGFAIEVSQVRSGGKELHRVRAGPEQDRDGATALRARLAAAGQKGSLVAP
jgi:DedD protein